MCRGSGLVNRTKTRVLVTGVGALIGQGIAQGLRATGRAHIIGLDRRVSLFGDEVCDETLLKPDIDEMSEAYLEFWKNTIRENDIELIIPGISVDMRFLDTHRTRIGNLGAKLCLNSADLIRLSEDKRDFMGYLRTLDIPVIPTVEPTTWQDAIAQLGPPPLLLKPSRGEGSVGVTKLRDQLDFEYWVKKLTGSVLIQRIIGTDAEEYTVGSFGLGDGDYIGPIIFRRTLTRAGNTGEAEVVEQPAIAATTEKLMQHLKPLGPTNLQFRMEGGRAFLLEINPRFSSSCSMRLGFGFNEAEMCLDFFVDSVRPGEPKLKQGFAQRHYADRFGYARSDF